MPAHRLHRPVRPGIAIIFVANALLAVACIEVGLPPDCSDSAVSRQATLTATAMSPSAIEVCGGQRVTFVVDAEVNGVLHLHGYDEEVPAATVHAGDELTLEFTAARSGQFPIELHLTDDPTGVSVAIFTVHER